MTWTLANAFATKLVVPTFKSDGNEIAVESLELADESLTVATPWSA